MKSIVKTRDELKEGFASFQSMVTWLEGRLNDLGSLHQAVLKLFGTTTSWIQIVLYAILIYIVTSIPGVGFDWSIETSSQ